MSVTILVGEPTMRLENPTIRLAVQDRDYTLCEAEGLAGSLLKLVSNLRSETTHEMPCTHPDCHAKKWCGVFGGIVGK